MKENKKEILLYVIIGILLLAVILLSVLLFLSRQSTASNDTAGTSTDSTSSELDDSSIDSDVISESGSSEGTSSDSNGNSSSESAEATTDKTEVTSENEDLAYAEIIVRGTWGSDGKPCASESVIIYNDSGQTITDWTLCLTFSSAPVILELWNGRYTISGNSVTITAESYNAEITAGGCIELGYNITADDVEPLSWYILSGSKQIGCSDSQDDALPARQDDDSTSETNTAADSVDSGNNTAAKTTEQGTETATSAQASGASEAGTEAKSSASDTTTGSAESKNQTSGQSSSEDSPYAIHGKLTVTSSGIMDKNGDAFQLKGVSTHGITWFPEYVNPDTFRYLKEKWDANVIRLAMYTDTGDPYGYCSGGDKDEIEALIDTGVSAATELGMYVIIDWHILNDGNPNTYLSEAKSFFEKMSKKYAGYGNVIYEIANEPNSGTTWAEMKSYAEQIISIIRANAPDAVIIVGTPTWCQDIDSAAADPLDQFSNIIYSVHFYAGTHKEDLRNKVQAAMETGLPVIISEFGLCDASGSGAIDYEQSDAWFELIEKYNLSYVGWNLSNKAETSSLISSSCSKISGFSDSELSDSGRYLKGKMTG